MAKLERARHTESHTIGIKNVGGQQLISVSEVERPAIGRPLRFGSVPDGYILCFSEETA